MPFEPGNCANPHGAPPKIKRFASALERAIAQDDGKRLRACADALLDSAASGEGWAIKELADRLDGRPSQSLTGADDGPLQIQEVPSQFEIARRLAFMLSNAAREVEQPTAH